MCLSTFGRMFLEKCLEIVLFKSVTRRAIPVEDISERVWRQRVPLLSYTAFILGRGQGVLGLKCNIGS